MAEIDDPTGQLREHYGKEKKTTDKLADEITAKGLVPFIPQAGWLIALILNFIKSRSAEQSLLSFENQIIDLIEELGKDIDFIKAKLEAEPNVKLIATAVERIFWGASERKVRRFAAVVAHTFVHTDDEQSTEDAATFIRLLDELSEDDIKVLKHYYRYQQDIVVENHAMTYNQFYYQDRMKDLLAGARNVGLQMDDFFARAGRLAGYGLLLPIEKDKFSVSLDDFAFRLTLLGKRLIRILEKTAKENMVVEKRR